MKTGLVYIAKNDKSQFGTAADKIGIGKWWKKLPDDSVPLPVNTFIYFSVPKTNSYGWLKVTGHTYDIDYGGVLLNIVAASDVDHFPMRITPEEFATYIREYMPDYYSDIHTT